MGEVIIKVRIYKGKEVKELDMLVDTGATFTKLSESVAKEVGIKCKYETEVVLADGSIKKRKLGTVEIGIGEVKREVPITVGKDGEKMFIGYTTLEILGFKVNPVTQELEKVRHIEYFNRMDRGINL